MKKLKLLSLIAMTILAASCNKDDDGDSDGVTDEYTVINNGNGAVSSITDDTDDVALNVAQAVPAVSDQTYPGNTPIIMFMDDKLLLSSIEDNFKVTENGKTIGGTIFVNEASTGFAVLTYVPAKTFSPDTTIEIVLEEGLQDDGGNTFAEEFTLQYTAGAAAVANFADGNGGFEDGLNGVTFLGDGNIMSGEQGCITAPEGDNFAAITSGDKLISDGTAIGNVSSIMLLGPIDESINSISYQFNFISSEFNDYVNTGYDDTAIITIYGPNGAYSEVIASVNGFGVDNSDCSSFPNMPDGGDGYAGAVGWFTNNESFASVGSPAYIVFTVTDVSDTILSSVLCVDNIDY
ncbi:hypothetical protein GCM10009117_24550 [Gangjinia marincola]|uniref:SbsA Ig-like domain-containing protein n=1 Tax=Gangjinia marincola TaxID=578463 RepID=A0ABN1MJB1_9FLAO